MDDMLEAIVSLFELDNGMVWTPDELAHAEERWKDLSPSAKEFLTSLSKDDLENICIGEYREEDLTVLRKFNGKWQLLPGEVDEFLCDIWEFVS